jgi:hypothetical protein
MLITSVPLIIPTFNNPTYTKNFVTNSISLGFRNIQIYDNNSTFPRMKELLVQLEEVCKIVRLTNNYGPHYVLRNPEIYESLPNIFCLSDPDVEYSNLYQKISWRHCLKFQRSIKLGKLDLPWKFPSRKNSYTPICAWTTNYGKCRNGKSSSGKTG